MPISKTDFIRGLQCKKMLWLDAHCPEQRIIPPEVQEKLNAGNEFGDKAMGIFGEFIETTALKADGRLDYAKMLSTTAECVEKGTPVICEAAFSWYGNYCAADILRKVDNVYHIYEVKNTFHVRKEFITDLGFQRLILRKNNLPITSSFLILRGDEQSGNPDETTKGGGHVRVEYVEHDNFLYKIVDVTAEAKKMERVAEKEIFALGKLKRKDEVCPNILMGEHCNSPYACWYYQFCKKANADENP